MIRHIADTQNTAERNHRMTLSPPSVSAHYSEPRRYPALVLLALLFVSGANAAQQNKDTRPSQAPAASPAITEQAEQRVIALTNDFRVQSALQPLEAEPRLTETARSFAAYLAGSGKLEHDADGTTPAERVKKRGYSYCMVAENLASEYSSAGFTADALARNVVDGWSESPTHRANMLQPDLTQIGVGVARSPTDGEYFAVQVFGRPLSHIVKFRVSNRSNATVRYEYRKRSVALGPKQARAHESCVNADLRLEKAGADVAVRPRDGGRYAIVDAGGGVFRVTEE